MKACRCMSLITFILLNVLLRSAFTAISPRQRADAQQQQGDGQIGNQDTRQLQPPPHVDQPAVQQQQYQAVTQQPAQQQYSGGLQQQQAAAAAQPYDNTLQQQHQQAQFQQQYHAQQPVQQQQNVQQQQPLQFEPQHYDPAPGVHVDMRNQQQANRDSNAVAANGGEEVIVMVGDQLLSENKACSEDVRRLCVQNRKATPGLINLKNDIEVVHCLLDADIDLDNDVRAECQHILWTTLLTLTKDERFHQVAQTECANDMSDKRTRIGQCQSQNERGHLLSCLLENKEQVKSEACKKFLTEVEAFVFSDYRLIHDFATGCGTEISSYHCGRLETRDEATHSQGATVECLEDAMEAFNVMADKARAEPDKFATEFGNLPSISETCQAQIMRAVEFQAEDYHLDRPLYFACKNDREQFCATTEAGDGKVLNCLLLHINEATMSKACNQKLLHRRQLIERDFKADHALVKMCSKELHKLGCDLDPKKVANTHNHPLLPVSHIVLCIENAIRTEPKNVDSQCQAVILEQRKILMAHFNMTPEVGVHCARELTQCQANIQKPELILHCLMGLVEKQQGSQQHFSQNNQQCLRAIEDLVTVANPMQDIRIDPVLQQACQHVLDTQCKNIPEGSPHVINCLVDQIRSPSMQVECQKRLYELLWFAVRDFRLTGPLFDKCHKDAVQLCHAPADWNKAASVADVERGPLIFTCLYRHAYQVEETAHVGELSPECSGEVKAELERRSRDINLMPEIMGSCTADLAAYCLPQSQQHQQQQQNFMNDGKSLMMCLQQNLRELQPECQKAMTTLTQIEFKAPHMNYDLQKACGMEMQQLCSGALGSDDQLMDCLVQSKSSHQMGKQCAETVTQMQLIQLSNVKFSPQFWMACQEDIAQHCKNLKEKPEILLCLHNVAMQSIQTNRGMLTQRCAHRVNVEMFQQNENVKLDPQLEHACSADEKKFCIHVEPSGGQMGECLRSNFARLSGDCQRMLFAREQSQTQNRQVDYSLMTACKSVIRDNCASAGQQATSENSGSDELWSCLKQAKRAGLVRDEHCTKVVLQRQIEENRDYRLNPVLATACKKDIPKYCHSEFSDVDQAHFAQVSQDADDAGRNNDGSQLHRASATHAEQERLEGRVIHCLKNKERHARKSLHSECANVISEVRREEAQDYRLDAYLATRCEADIKSLCKDMDVSEVYECLKRGLQKNLIRREPCKAELSRIIREGRVDIHVDTHLASTCSQDLVRYCHAVPQGDGRKMQCLLTVLAANDDAMPLDADCAQLLKERQELFEVVNKLGPDVDEAGKEISSVGELVSHVRHSRASSYLMTVLFVIIAVIFVGGLLCGRVSKGYAYRELKNR